MSSILSCIVTFFILKKILICQIKKKSFLGNIRTQLIFCFIKWTLFFTIILNLHIFLTLFLFVKRISQTFTYISFYYLYLCLFLTFHFYAFLIKVFSWFIKIEIVCFWKRKFKLFLSLLRLKKSLILQI